MKRFPCLFAICTALPMSLAFAASGQPASPPNVVVIFCDDMGYADIGPFGAKAYATPNLDRMAREGRKFTNFHVSQPVCSASRAALLSGCYNNRIGIHGALGPGAKHGISAAERTLAEVFKEKGYATGMAGKWHLGHHPQFLPTRHGFDEYLGLPYSNDMWPFHPEAKKGTYPPLPLIENETIIDAEVTPAEQPNLTTWYTERAVKFIERNKSRPFFYYLAHSMPHVPLFVSEKFKGKSGAGLFGDVIQEIDWSVGQVLETLKKNALGEKTIVIFTSDNGPWLSYGEHAGSAKPLREGKGTAWEGGTRVPCIMRWPGKLPAGTSSDAMLMTIDLLPTLAKLIGAGPVPLPIDGLDVWPLIAGTKGAKNPHEAYFTWYADNQLQAVMSADGRWKLVLPHAFRTLNGKPGGTGGIPAKYEQSKIAQPELYEVGRDVGEAKEVSAQHPQIVQQLLALAEKAREELGDSLTKRKGKGNREPGRLGSVIR
ncbi:MAG: sulfatase [Opitutaceae bacterium]|nr:sulfatase [Opitutaceae bacterium]